MSRTQLWNFYCVICHPWKPFAHHLHVNMEVQRKAHWSELIWNKKKSIINIIHVFNLLLIKPPKLNSSLRISSKIFRIEKIYNLLFSSPKAIIIIKNGCKCTVYKKDKNKKPQKCPIIETILIFIMFQWKIIPFDSIGGKSTSCSYHKITGNLASISPSQSANTQADTT